VLSWLLLPELPLLDTDGVMAVELETVLEEVMEDTVEMVDGDGYVFGILRMPHIFIENGLKQSLLFLCCIGSTQVQVQVRR